jgi:nucleoside-diphosphate-sugar epimerase
VISIDTSKAKEILGFKAKITIAEGLKKIVQWFRQERELTRVKS